MFGSRAMSMAVLVLVMAGFLVLPGRAQHPQTNSGDFVQTTDGKVWRGDVRIRHRLLGRPRILSDTLVFNLGRVAFFRDRGRHFGVYRGRAIVERMAKGRIEIYSEPGRPVARVQPTWAGVRGNFYTDLLPWARQKFYLYKPSGDRGLQKYSFRNVRRAIRDSPEHARALNRYQYVFIAGGVVMIAGAVSTLFSAMDLLASAALFPLFGGSVGGGIGLVVGLGVSIGGAVMTNAGRQGVRNLVYDYNASFEPQIY